MSGVVGDEVVAPGRRARLGRDGLRLPDRRDRRRGARPDLEIALQRELVVRVGHDAARQAQVVGEHARGRQPRARRQAAVLDGGPQRFAQRATLAAASDVHLDQQGGRAGPISSWLRGSIHDASDDT